MLHHLQLYGLFFMKHIYQNQTNYYSQIRPTCEAIFLRRFRLYTHAILSFPRSYLAANHHNNKNWIPFVLTHNLWLIFMGIKQKKKIILKKIKKTEFFNIAKRWAISAKISRIGPWVSRIDWCKGHC